MSALLTQVHLQGPTTRAALTTALGLNRSTIGDLTGELEDLGPAGVMDLAGVG